VNALDSLSRRAAVAEFGGFRPPDDPTSSWFGRVLLAGPGEVWPLTDGEPMLALAQINLSEVPIVPEPLNGLAFLTIFIGPRELPVDEPNGTGWCLRTYRTLDELEPLYEPAPAKAGDPKLRKGEPLTYRAVPLRWHEALDWPSRDDVPTALLDDWDDAAETDDRQVLDGLKLGGWPACVQAAVDWAERGERLSGVEFVLQIDSEPKSGFEVGFGGAAYIGYRDATGTWHLAWQSM
jgi:Domain of unknown function (DUF1963)